MDSKPQSSLRVVVIILIILFVIYVIYTIWRKNQEKQKQSRIGRLFRFGMGTRYVDKRLSELSPRTIIYFKSDSCHYCAEFDPLWERLRDSMAKYTQISFIEVKDTAMNTATSSPLSSMFGVTGFPTIVRVQGQYTSDQLTAMTESEISSLVSGMKKFNGDRSSSNIESFIRR